VTPLFFHFLVAALPAYLIGSFPTGYVIGKLFKLGDIRSIGSGNIGATNMVRAGGKKLGALVLLVDMVKAAIGFSWSAEFVEIYQPDLRWEQAGTVSLCVLALLAVFIGHMFPVWLKFKGGKGISIMIGSLLCLPLLSSGVPVVYWPLLIYLAVWLGCYALTKTSSLSGLSATLAVAIYFWVSFFLADFPASICDSHQSMTHCTSYWSIVPVLSLVYSFTALLIFYRHTDNIRRLLRGEELAFRRKEKETM
jgi:glycerol-3-phosphate acyltransferase PlsY